MQVAPKLPWWHHNSATIFRPGRQCMGLMMSWLRIFRDRSITSVFVVPKLIHYERGLALPYSINFGLDTTCQWKYATSKLLIFRLIDSPFWWFPSGCSILGLVSIKWDQWGAGTHYDLKVLGLHPAEDGSSFVSRIKLTEVQSGSHQKSTQRG